MGEKKSFLNSAGSADGELKYSKKTADFVGSFYFILHTLQLKDQRLCLCLLRDDYFSIQMH